MARLAALNLIEVFDVYLILGFIAGTVMRWKQYRTYLDFIFAFPNRWPKLLQLASKHRSVFLTWPTLLPIGLTFLLMAVNSLCLRLIFVDAQVTPSQLREHLIVLGIIVALGVGMLYQDLRAIFYVGVFDRLALEKDLDQAEYWLRSWVSPAVRILTFGYVNPRQIVNDEVYKALVDASLVVNVQMWRWSLQLGTRLAFGLALWLTWAILLR
jgi:hypothetical protein